MKTKYEIKKGEFIPLEFIMPKKVEAYLKKKKFNIKKFLKMKKWEYWITNDLLDENYDRIFCKSIKIIINGIAKNNKDKVYISPKTFKLRPFKIASISNGLNGYAICYLMFIKGRVKYKKVK